MHLGRPQEDEFLIISKISTSRLKWLALTVSYMYINLSHYLLSFFQLHLVFILTTWVSWVQVKLQLNDFNLHTCKFDIKDIDEGHTPAINLTIQP